MDKDGQNPHGHDHDQQPFVELADFPSRFEADVVLAKLQANDIEATVEYLELGGGAYPDIDAHHRIFVLGADLETARLLIAEQ